MTFPTERLDEETERRIQDFRYCALSDTCVDDLSPYTEDARNNLRSRIREITLTPEEARRIYDFLNPFNGRGFLEEHEPEIAAKLRSISSPTGKSE